MRTTQWDHFNLSNGASLRTGLSLTASVVCLKVVHADILLAGTRKTMGAAASVQGWDGTYSETPTLMALPAASGLIANP